MNPNQMDLIRRERIKTSLINNKNIQNVKTERLSPEGNENTGIPMEWRQEKTFLAPLPTPPPLLQTPPLFPTPPLLRTPPLLSTTPPLQNSQPPSLPPVSVATTAAANQSFISFLLASNLKNRKMTPHNYSEFMRNLAAKYNNNSNNNNHNTTEENFSPMLINNKEEILKNDAPKKQTNKESHTFAIPQPTRQQSPKRRQHHNKRSEAAIRQESNQLSSNIQLTPQNNVANPTPLVSSLLSNLHLSTNISSPLIDMSSTQALVTLAQASKQLELQNILRNSPDPTNACSSQSRATVQKSQRRKSSNSDHSFVNDNNNSIRPLDLSAVPIKRPRFELPCNSNSLADNIDEDTKKSFKKTYCQMQNIEITSWTVDDVCNFVGSDKLCADYVQNFREQCIDGSSLPLLTEDHLLNSLGMKLGPALKLKSLLAKKLGGPCPCTSCTSQNSNNFVLRSTNTLLQPQLMGNVNKTMQVTRTSSNCVNFS